jgi:hypothetical protein
MCASPASADGSALALPTATTAANSAPIATAATSLRRESDFNALPPCFDPQSDRPTESDILAALCELAKATFGLVLSVIGPGFGRTGTMSFKNALETLGFGPCYHMSEVYESDHVDEWIAAIDGSPPEWNTFLSAYNSVVDWPACAFWKSIYAANPSAKIVLTRRDPASWFDSMEKTIFQALRAQSDDQQLMRWRVSTRKLIFDETFHNDFSRANCTSVLRAHENDVIASVSQEQLLVFDVADGWEPLCAFLCVPVPEEPFPRVNTTAEFRVWTGLAEST